MKPSINAISDLDPASTVCSNGVAPCSVFAMSVYDICRKIPRGTVYTYGYIARILGSSARAVGTALRRNPYAPEVPCHRVIKADRTLGGFMGQTDKMHPMMIKKKKLLENEGVVFDGDFVNPQHIINR